jgi:hypothetical protein
MQYKDQEDHGGVGTAQYSHSRALWLAQIKYPDQKNKRQT